MAIEVFNRHEIKFVLNQKQYELLRDEIPKYMEQDAFNLNGKTYKVCNLYLDTATDDFIRTAIEKPVFREKLRLRSYGKAKLDDIVYFEIKKKCDGFGNKRRTPCKLADAYEYLQSGELPKNSIANRQIINEINYVQSIFHAYPKVYISYDRFAFFGKDDAAFRLTLDTNILTRRTNLRLEDDSCGEKLLEKGMWVMEAKAYSSVPLWFARFLSKNEIYCVSFSKYGNEYINFLKRKIK